MNASGPYFCLTTAFAGGRIEEGELPFHELSEGELILVDAIKVEEYKTKTVVNMLKALGAEGKALIVTDTVNKMLVGSAGNIPGVKTSIVGEMNTYDVLNSRKMILTVAAVDKLEEVYAK